MAEEKKVVAQEAKAPAKKTEILVSLIFGHHTGTLAEFGNNLLVFINIAAVKAGHITAVTPHPAADFSYFFCIHNRLVIP